MTRDERRTRKEERLTQQLAATKRQLAQVEAQGRAHERKQRNQRRFLVGKLADDAGLFTWDDVTLSILFQALAELKGTPNPVAVLDGLLGGPPDLEALGAAAHDTVLPGAPYGSDASDVSREGNGSVLS